MRADGLILAGGKSSRMGGVHKGSLTFGNETFTDILAEELKREVRDVWLSYGRKAQTEVNGCGIVQDIYADCGPIGGLHAGLTVCREDVLFVVACDMPFLKAELFLYLCEQLHCRETAGRMQEGKGGAFSGALYDGVVPVADGKLHPLAAVYRKSAARVLEEQIGNNNYRVRDALSRLNILYEDVTERNGFVQMLRNINTIQEYEAEVNIPFDHNITVFSNTGKERQTK